MKIIAVMTQKGGVGKTMTASSLAYILGVEHGKRVLIADADQQGNISMLYGRFEPQGIGMSELLEKHRAIGGTYSTEQLIDETPYENISIIPTNGFLMRTNMTLLLLEQDNQILRFKMAMEEIQDRYDYCIVDCGLLMDSDECSGGSRPRDSSGEGRRVRDRGDCEHGGAVGRPARIQSRHQDEAAHDDASEEHDKSSG